MTDEHLINHAFNGVQECFERIEALESRFATIDHLIKSSNTAETLFASKVHELKSIDKKRDDVIDVLCQKIVSLSEKIDFIFKCSRPLIKSENVSEEQKNLMEKLIDKL